MAVLAIKGLTEKCYSNYFNGDLTRFYYTAKQIDVAILFAIVAAVHVG